MAANRIYIQVDFQHDDAIRRVKDLEAKFSGMGKTAEVAGRQAQAGFSSVSVAIDQTTRGLGNLKALFAGAFAGGATAGIIAITSEFQRANITLTQMLGSAQAARETLSDLKDLSQKQPFAFTDLQQLTTLLGAFGFKGKELLDVVRSIADAASSVGGTVEKLNQIGLAIGQIKVKGRLNAEELNKQLGEAGIPASQYIADALSRQQKKSFTSGDVLKLAEKQRLDAEAGIEAILSGINRKSGGLGKSVAEQVYSAQFQKLLDQVKFIAAELGNALDPAIKATVSNLQTMVNWIGQAVKGFAALSPEVRTGTAAVAAFTATIAAAPLALGLFSKLAPSFGSMASSVSTIVAGLSTASFARSAGLTGALVGMEVTLSTILGLLPAVAVGIAALWAGSVLLKFADGNRKVADSSDYIRRLNQELRGVKDPMDQAAEGMYRFGKAASFTQEEIDKVNAKSAELLRQSKLLFPKEITLPGGGSALVRGTSSDFLGELGKQLAAGQIKLDEPKKEKSLLKVNEAEIKAAEDAARAKLEQTQKQRTAIGLFKIESEYAELLKKALEAGAGKALKDLRTSIVLEVQNEKAKLFGQFFGSTYTPGSAAKLAKEAIVPDGKPSERMELKEREFRNAIEVTNRISEIQNKALDETLRQQEAVITQSRDMELRSLDLIQAVTVQQRIAVSQKRLQIESDAAVKILDIRKRLLDLELNLEILTVEAELRARFVKEEEIGRVTFAIRQLYKAKTAILEQGSADEIAALRKDSEVRNADIVLSQQKKTYEQLKDSAGRVFDALLAKSSSVWAAIGNSFKTAVLTAIKEVVTSRIAAQLMQIFGLGQVSFAKGGQIGGSPVFGGGGGGKSSPLAQLLGFGGFAASGGGFSPIPGAPGGTPGFAGPVSLGGGQAGGAGGVGGLKGIGASLSGTASSLKGILSGLGNIGFGAKGGDFGGEVAGSFKGVGGVKGGAMLAAGGALAFDGLRRGGKIGLVETTAGGALIGAKFGGPVGAAIGAGIGAVAGTIRLFVKGAQEKIVDKVKSVYGITISKQFAKDPLMGIIKQSFGGNVDVGIRSQQIKDLVELYAMSTGQNAFGINNRPVPGQFALSGGTLYQQPVFQNGLQVPSITVPQNTQGPTVIQLDSEATVNFLSGQAVEAISGNPRVVQSSLYAANQQNAGRRQNLALALNPGMA